METKKRQKESKRKKKRGVRAWAPGPEVPPTSPPYEQWLLGGVVPTRKEDEKRIYRGERGERKEQEERKREEGKTKGATEGNKKGERPTTRSHTNGII